MSEYRTDPYHAESLDSYQEYIARKRSAEEVTIGNTRRMPVIPSEPSTKQHIAWFVLCALGACSACIPVVGIIPAIVFYWLAGRTGVTENSRMTDKYGPVPTTQWPSRT